MSAQATPRLVIDGGLFVTFEGGEGAGKSSAILALYMLLEAQGYRVHVTREPGYDRLGEQLRWMLLSSDFELDQIEELFLFAADRAHHVRRDIEPALAAGMIVLCDRYADSTTAYQGTSPELLEKVQLLHRLATRGRWPDRTYLLDVIPETGLRRVAKRNGEISKFDARDLDYHHALRQRFLELAQRERQRIQVIDASQSEQAVRDSIATDLIRLLSTKTITTLPAPHSA